MNKLSDSVQLVNAQKEIFFQNQEREKRAAELVIANIELAYQSQEKEKRAAELVSAKGAGENVLRAYKEKEAVLNNISDGIVCIDNDWRYTFCNEAALNTQASLNFRDPLGKILWDVHPELEGTVFWHKYHEAMLTQKVIELEGFYAPMKIWLFVKIYPSSGGLTIFYKNITERKQIERDLRRTLMEVSDYKFALDEASIVAITDRKGMISYANDKFCKISKYSMDELIGQDHRIVNSNYHPKEFIKKIWTTIGNGKVWRGEIRNKAKDGSFYWVDTTIVPFLDVQGKPYQYLAIRADITDRKIAEDKIRSLNEELEHRVKERTEELESFSYSVSHDLRAPLRAVNGYAQILKEDKGHQLDSEANRIVDKIVANATRMGLLIDGLLAFSRLGRKELILWNIPMNEVVNKLCREMKGEYENKNVQFRIHELQSAKGDLVAIKQVWVNLISNAAKFSKFNENALVEIGSEVKQDEVIYYIRDNGAGFDMRYADKLFGVFQRLHNNDQFEGTGVGLAIVHRIITKHGGKVWAEGCIGEGATFYFSLPLNSLP